MVDISCIDTASPTAVPRARPGVVAAALVLALALVLPACAKKDQAATNPLPAATMTDLTTGKAADWPTGKPLVVNFWASWCSPCRAEMPAFDQVANDLEGQVDIIGVTDDTDLDAAREAAAEAGVQYPLLVDVDQTLLIDLEITGLPGTVFVDADGQIIGRHLGALTEDELTKEIEDRYGISR